MGHGLCGVGRWALGVGSAGLQAELRGAALAGLPAPQIDGELPRHCDEGFLARQAGGARAFGQHCEALFHRRIVRLERVAR